MPVHDWTRVDAGTFHHFHTGWLVHISDALNGGLLPSGYYALAEQSAGPVGPDVLALERRHKDTDEPTDNGSSGRAIALAPPRVKNVYRCGRKFYLRKQRRLAIRHRSGDRLVAVVEIVSPGNKSSAGALRRFVEKAADIMLAGVHLLVVDVFGPSRRDPQGIHGAIWSECGEVDYKLSKKEPLIAASYEVTEEITAYVESFAVGDHLPDMPLFLDRGDYVDVSLESTYRTAWTGLPKHLQKTLSR